MNENTFDFKEKNEEETKVSIVIPKLKEKGWNQDTNIRMEYNITAGKYDSINKKRNKPKRADVVLFYKNNPLVVIEIKRPSVSVYDGVQQAKDYAKTLNAAFAFSTNGVEFIEIDLLTKKETNLMLDEMPNREELIAKYEEKINNNQLKKLIDIGYKNKLTDFEPRYYQINAILKTMEAISNNQNRILLVLATGTGKTYVASQIIYKLLETNTKKRVLFLADRNSLISQTQRGDFSIFNNKMKILKTEDLKDSVLLSSYQVFLSTYQQLMGENLDQKYYEVFDKNFFDLIIIDEAHRGSANEASNWRVILDHFNNATHIGLTATPKPEDNYEYFSSPVYTYSLKQGIEDGFLAPYSIINVELDIDKKPFNPSLKYDYDDRGNEVEEDKIYFQKDQDKTVVVKERTELIAKYVSDYLKNKNDRMAKTIFFCQDQEHASRMRQALINENNDKCLENDQYVARITSNEKNSESLIEKFTSIYEEYPVLVTTSKMLTTGVDTKMCRYIVLDANIKSSIEFKQIIGRGTRIVEDFNKMAFTIIDFRGITEQMKDKDFDGIPEAVNNDKLDSQRIKMIFEKIESNPNKITSQEQKINKLYFSDEEVNVVEETTTFIKPDGTRYSGSEFDYYKSEFLKQFPSAEDFRSEWINTNSFEKSFGELYFGKEQKFVVFKDNEDNNEVDDFDLILNKVYGLNFRNKKERINTFKLSSLFNSYKLKTKEIIEKLLNKYDETNIYDIESNKVFRLNEFEELGGLFNILKTLQKENNQEYSQLFLDIKKVLYKE